MKKTLRIILSAMFIVAVLMSIFSGCKKEEISAIAQTDTEISDESQVVETVTEEDNQSSTISSDMLTKSTESIEAYAGIVTEEKPDISKNEVNCIKDSSGKVTGFEIKIWGTFSEFSSISIIDDEEVDYHVYMEIDNHLINFCEYECDIGNGEAFICEYSLIKAEKDDYSSTYEYIEDTSELVEGLCSYKFEQKFALIKVDLSTPVSSDNCSVNLSVGKGIFKTSDGKQNDEFKYYLSI